MTVLTKSQQIDLLNEARRYLLNKSTKRESVHTGLCHSLLVSAEILKFKVPEGDQRTRISSLIPDFYEESSVEAPSSYYTYWFKLNEEGTRARIEFIDKLLKKRQ